MRVYVVIIHTEESKYLEVFRSEIMAESFLADVLNSGEYEGQKVTDHYYFEREVRGGSR